MESASAPLSLSDLSREQISDIRLAASGMTGAARRAFMAEMTLKYCGGSARQAESVFGWSKYAVATGLGEKRTGIVCLGAQSPNSGRLPWEKKEPEAAEYLRRVADANSQQDPTFQSSLTYTRLTAEAAAEALRDGGFGDNQIPSPSAMAEILNRMGYRLRKVVKAKPLKKIEETDAIFENVAERDRQACDDANVIRLSVDCKATVRIGDISRGGLTRGDNRACDHDFGTGERYVPCGILEENSGQLHITFGSSYKTSDFIADTLREWWFRLSDGERQSADLIQIKMDNGPESGGRRTQFLSRMVGLSDEIGKPLQLVYYPPYHSKYNPIERCWGILEMHWNGTMLSDAMTMLRWAATMTWKGLSPVVGISKKIYKKGVSLTKSAMKSVERRLKRNPLLPKWDILIKPEMSSAS